MNTTLGLCKITVATLSIAAIPLSGRATLQSVDPVSPDGVATPKQAIVASSFNDFVRVVRAADEAVKKAQAKSEIDWDAFSAGKAYWIASKNGVGAENVEAAKTFMRAFARQLAVSNAGDLLESAWANPSVEVVRAQNAEPPSGDRVSVADGQQIIEELGLAFAGLAALSLDDGDATTLQFAVLSQLLMTHYLVDSSFNGSSKADAGNSETINRISREVQRSTLTLWWLCDRREMTLEQKLCVRQCLLRRGESAWSRSIAGLMRRNLPRIVLQIAKDDEAIKDVTRRAEAIIRAYEASDDIVSMSKAWDSIQAVQEIQLDSLPAADQDRIRIDRRIFETYRAMRAEWSGMVATLGVRAYKDVYGQFPEDAETLRRSGFAELAPEACSGKDIRMRRIGSRFLLYSLGADGVDNDGKLPEDNATPWSAFTPSFQSQPSDRVWIDER